MKIVHLICAARPNFMKVAPLYHRLAKEPTIDVQLIHTGQHYDHIMSGIFLEQLGLPDPHFHLGIRASSHAAQTGQTMIAYENLCLEESSPDLTIVVGDVNATVACALTAKKLNLVVAHLEAGLRSFDRTMPEEVNRIVTDSISDYLWTPSLDGDEHLLKEGISQDKIHRVGNIMMDSLVMMSEKIDQAPTLNELDLTVKTYGAVTLHRPSNVDNPAVLTDIFKEFARINEPLILPVHPRTRKTIENLARESIPNTLRLIDPLSYIDFMCLVKNSAFVITDSGGLQEETTYLGVPCFTLRPNTERPITITHGTNNLVDHSNLIETMSRVLSSFNPAEYQVPDLWDGNTAERVAQHILSFI